MDKHTISVRVSEQEFIAIKDKAFDANRSIGSWCKLTILDKLAKKKNGK